MELCDGTDEKKTKTYTATKIIHSTLFSKICILLYLEDVKFLISRVGCLVTKTYAHFTFEQVKYKKEFILMNQRLRQNSKYKIEKDFYKLLNNLNYGHDCTSNLDDFKFEPIYDEIDEISYLRKYHSLFDLKISKFVNSKLIETEIQKINSSKNFLKFKMMIKMMKLNQLKFQL